MAVAAGAVQVTETGALRLPPAVGAARAVRAVGRLRAGDTTVQEHTRIQFIVQAERGHCGPGLCREYCSGRSTNIRLVLLFTALLITITYVFGV